jgi:hypothetical protein
MDFCRMARDIWFAQLRDHCLSSRASFNFRERVTSAGVKYGVIAVYAYDENDAALKCLSQQ